MGWSPGILEILVIGVVALLIFGSRLPQVMRSLGKGIVEFKKGLRGIEDHLDSATDLKSLDVTGASDAADDPYDQAGTPEGTGDETTGEVKDADPAAETAAEPEAKTPEADPPQTDAAPATEASAQPS